MSSRVESLNPCGLKSGISGRFNDAQVLFHVGAQCLRPPEGASIAPLQIHLDRALSASAPAFPYGTLREQAVGILDILFHGVPGKRMR
ncbi:hypothetical protein Oscil6304_2047 [Oscillatoria acuminata PCC 6304]|uniref:Uncharacterized protein n=1 Tax=Oscillatoria acuminata PCC 6304 TaxID=56110 RepID=K9TI60_9CYAN|nr:hypothetical protein Oscil6304_2047 [Oscillatoria acuminata PCC 6304]